MGTVITSLAATVKNALLAHFSIVVDDSDIRFSQAPEGKGDLALSCGVLAKKLKKAPAEIAMSLQAPLYAHPGVAAAYVDGPYLNLQLYAGALFEAVCMPLEARLIRTENPERIMVEYLSPNTNKPLHLGHVRNGVLGSAVANMLISAGHTVIRADLINDRGIHICKSMLGYKLFANGSTPSSAHMKGDHFVGDWYVRFEQAKKEDPSLMQQAEELLQLWEAEDPETRRLWSLMNGWVYEGFNATQKRYGFDFNRVYRESEIYLLGKSIVSEGLARGVFVKGSDGAVLFPLPVTFGKNKAGQDRVAKVLNPDGTSIYLTQDIGTAVRKVEDYALDRSLYVVASEQDNHFRVLFEILNALGFSWARSCHHLSYEMVELPNGKMKSREGVVVDADDLLDSMASLARLAIRERQQDLPDEEVALRAETIALSAIKFYLLSYRSQSRIIFNPEQSLSFEGDTGPYCLYAYARIKSILAKAETQGVSAITPSREQGWVLGTQTERALALELLTFPQSLARATENHMPSSVAESVLSIAKAFNRFYRADIMLGDDQILSQQRLALAVATAETLNQGLSLLGIRTLEHM